MSFTCLQNSFLKSCLFTFCTTYSHSNIQEYVFVMLFLFFSCDFRELGSWIPGTSHSNTTVARSCPTTCNSKEIQMHVDKLKSPHAGSNVHGRKNYSWCICYSSVFYPLSERISKHAFQKYFMQLQIHFSFIWIFEIRLSLLLGLQLHSFQSVFQEKKNPKRKEGRN